MFRGILPRDNGNILIFFSPLRRHRLGRSSSRSGSVGLQRMMLRAVLPRLDLRVLRFLRPILRLVPSVFRIRLRILGEPLRQLRKALRRHSPRLRAFGKSLGRHRRRTRFIGSRRIPGSLTSGSYSNLRLRKSIQIRNVHLLQRILKIRRNQIRIARIKPDSRAGEGLPLSSVPERHRSRVGVDEERAGYRIRRSGRPEMNPRPSPYAPVVSPQNRRIRRRVQPVLIQHRLVRSRLTGEERHGLVQTEINIVHLLVVLHGTNRAFALRNRILSCRNGHTLTTPMS
ncbi:MAG: hypothetical protein BWY06_03426 [Candidatus Latescibacteria bacterium ADurb.Bin168]|nr:MAG: hypothetical protein BWY06_03426 [Candidatus Latescibacteria bacterium ADurb.Bin168]